MILEDALQGFSLPTDINFAALHDESRVPPYPKSHAEEESLERLGVDHLNPEPVPIPLSQIEKPFGQFCSILDESFRILLKFYAMDFLPDTG